MREGYVGPSLETCCSMHSLINLLFCGVDYCIHKRPKIMIDISPRKVLQPHARSFFHKFVQQQLATSSLDMCENIQFDAFFVYPSGVVHNVLYRSIVYRKRDLLCDRDGRHTFWNHGSPVINAVPTAYRYYPTAHHGTSLTGNLASAQNSSHPGDSNLSYPRRPATGGVGHTHHLCQNNACRRVVYCLLSISIRRGGEDDVDDDADT